MLTMILKIVLAAVILLAVLLVTVMVFCKATVRSRDTVKRPNERSYGTGDRRALVLYQPSNHGSNVAPTLSMAQALAEDGYSVTVNYPSELLPYHLEDYDALIFGTNAYMGQTAQPLKKYLSSHLFTGKKVVLYVTGRRSEQPELEELKSLVPVGNEVFAVKVKAAEGRRLADFVKQALRTGPDGTENRGWS